MKNFATGYNGMRLLPRLIIVLVICLIAMSLPAVPAQAQCTGPIIEISPGSGVPGTQVTVAGQYFDEDKYVDIYYDEALKATDRTNGSGAFTIAFTIPQGDKGDHQVLAVVGAGTGTVKRETYFYVKPGLTVSPKEGPVGTNVTVQGQGFAQNEQDIELLYYTGDDYETVERHITADDTGSWEISFQIPPSVKGEHKLDAQSTESKLSDIGDATFNVMPWLSMNKSSGSVGESITIMGSTFMAYEKNIQILFDGQAVITGIKADPQGNWQASFKVPEMPTDTYVVIAQGESTPTEDISAFSFKIKPDIVLPSNEGYVGMNLTVTGHGFAADEDVDIMYDGSQAVTATTNATGSFVASFIVPETHHSGHQVTAEDATGNNAAAILTLESELPDTPSLISPSSRSRVGFIGRVAPTFEWSAVSDESGVSYSLQIAASANVTATGEFVHPLVSKEDLVETSYTLEETEALPYGTYYWIVQAVDKAGNAGDWTTPRSFRAGLLPLWALTLIIVAIVMLLVALIYVSITRRRKYYWE